MDQPLSAKPFGTFAPTGLVAQLLAVTRRMGRSWGERRLAFLARRCAIALLGGRPLDVEALGARFRLYPYKNVCEKRILFTPQDFDPAERAALAEALAAAPAGRPFVFLDVGANIGGYGLFVAALAGPLARVVAIEPQPDIFERLVFNIRLNGFATVKALALAVTDRPGEVSLFLNRQNKGEASVKIVGPEQGLSIRIEGRPLVDIVADENLTHLDAIKLDVEGAEDIVLEPFFAEAPESLWPRLVILEKGSDRWSVDLCALLAARGYDLQATTRNNFVFLRP